MLCPHLVGTIDENLAKVLTNRLNIIKESTNDKLQVEDIVENQ
jgi:hypothetical protein